MKSQQEHRAEQLEGLLSSRANQNVSAEFHAATTEKVDAELSEMVVLAQYLQASPALTADPAFAQRLERKVLAHSVRQMQMKAAQKKGHWLFGWAPQMWVGFAAILMCMLVGTGTVLAMANGTENPRNPLYGVKEWEQHVQLSFANSPENKATVSMEIARDRMKAAGSMTDPSEASVYQQMIQDAEQEIDAASQIIKTLPVGADRQRLSNELATLKTDTRQALYSWLPKLSLMGQVVTTTFLGDLGAPVPNIQRATVVVTSHPVEQATITVTGKNFTSSTRLVVNNQLIAGNCTSQQNNCVFVIPWHDQNPPHTLAVLNENNTAAQTNAITFVGTDNGNGGNPNNGNDGNNANGTNSGGKGTNENGDTEHDHNGTNNGAKPTSTPGAKPTSTPNLHR